MSKQRTLLEILVEQLPEWPEGEQFATQDRDGEIRFYWHGDGTEADFYPTGNERAKGCPRRGALGREHGVRVTREEYEEARNARGT